MKLYCLLGGKETLLSEIDLGEKTAEILRKLRKNKHILLNFKALDLIEKFAEIKDDRITI